MATALAADKVFDIPAIEYREAVLSNGLKIVMSRSGEIPMVAVNTTFHIGAKDEEEDKTGLAHLFEHLMFEGSPNIPAGKFDEILTQNGGDSNAYTSWDSTSYYISLPSSHLETGLWLDSDRISGFGFSEESLEIQKDVVIEEKLLYVDNSPYGSVEEESSKRLFKNSGYRWTIIGNMDDVRKLTVNDLRIFYEKYYKPDNAVISIVGDIDYDRTFRLVEKYYGGIKPGTEFSRKTFNEESIVREERADFYDNVHLDGKFLFYRIPEMGTKEFYSLSILNGILSEGESSRFFQELEYKNELVTECDSSLYGMEQTSIFCISALAMEGRKLKYIEDTIDVILEDVKAGNINDREILKIKNKIETYHNSRRQSIVSLAERFSYFKTFYNDCEKINFEILNYLSISKYDIIEAANRFLNRNQRVVLDYYPKTKAKFINDKRYQRH